MKKAAAVLRLHKIMEKMEAVKLNIDSATKEQVLNALSRTKYKNEMKYGILTVWFHKGNGWNFRVSYNFRTNKTKIVRYKANEHWTMDDSKLEFEGFHIITDYEEAEFFFSKNYRHFDDAYPKGNYSKRAKRLRYVAIYNKVGRFANANLKDRTEDFWSYDEKKAIEYFKRENVEFELKVFTKQRGIKTRHNKFFSLDVSFSRPATAETHANIREACKKLKEWRQREIRKDS